MLRIEIPGRGELALEHVVLDVNGTIAFDGALIDGVPEALQVLRDSLAAVILTSDTHGTAEGLGQAVGARVHVVSLGEEAEQKAEFVRELGPGSVVAIGNGANDVAMLREAALGICVIGGEGACADAIESADVVVTDPVRALGLLAHPHRLYATLRS
jgi:P-type E1-E2 ATPase